MFDYNEIMNKAVQKLKELYGDDFKFEEGDEFVFSLKNCSLYIALEEGCLKTKFIGDKVIDLDISCPVYEEGGE
jgi:hypothetical protein